MAALQMHSNQIWPIYSAVKCQSDGRRVYLSPPTYKVRKEGAAEILDYFGGS